MRRRLRRQLRCWRNWRRLGPRRQWSQNVDQACRPPQVPTQGHQQLTSTARCAEQDAGPPVSDHRRIGAIASCLRAPPCTTASRARFLPRNRPHTSALSEGGPAKRLAEWMTASAAFTPAVRGRGVAARLAALAVSLAASEAGSGGTSSWNASTHHAARRRKAAIWSPLPVTAARTAAGSR